MFSFLETNIVLPLAILQAIQPYTHECSCPLSLPLDTLSHHHPVVGVDIPDHMLSILSEASSLSIIIEEKEDEFQIPSTSKTKTSIPSSSELYFFPIASPVPLLLPKPPDDSTLTPPTSTAHTDA